MRRTPIVLAATVAGLAGTLGFKTQDITTAQTAAVSSTDTGTSSTAGSSGTSGSSGSGSATGSSATRSSSSSQARTAGSPASSSTTVTSDAVSTIYGNVQLKVTLTGGKITAIENAQLPANDPHSVQINQYAGPQLQQSALSHADGTVDAVSGATYTTNGYEQALQSALDQAGATTTTTGSSS